MKPEPLIGCPTSGSLVTIVIPAFNCGPTIQDAVRSCLDQRRANIEVVVVNDGSTDDTRARLAEFGDDIRIVDQSNGGLAAARDAGQRAARGDFVAWMDGDDLSTPDRIQTQLTALEAVPGAALACSDFSAFRDLEEDFDASHIEKYYGLLRRAGGVAGVFSNQCSLPLGEAGEKLKIRWGIVYEAMLEGNFVHPPTVLMRRALCRQLGGFDHTLRYSSDYEYLIRASRVTPFVFVDSPLLRYRRHDLQMSRAAQSGKLQLETVLILEKVRHEDSELAARRDKDISRLSAKALLSAAYALARSDRIHGFRLLRAAASRRFLPLATLLTFLRLTLPNVAIDATKWLRDKMHAPLALPFFLGSGLLDDAMATLDLASCLGTI